MYELLNSGLSIAHIFATPAFISRTNQRLQPIKSLKQMKTALPKPVRLLVTTPQLLLLICQVSKHYQHRDLFSP